MEPKIGRLLRLLDLVIKLNVSDDEVSQLIEELRIRKLHNLPSPTNGLRIEDVFTKENISRFALNDRLSTNVFRTIKQSKYLSPSTRIAEVTENHIRGLLREHRVGKKIAEVVRMILTSEGCTIK